MYKSSLGKGNSKWSGPFQRGDNYKNSKIGWGHLKIFLLQNFNQTYKYKIAKLTMCILEQLGFRIVQMKDTPPPLSQGEIIAKE
jgi:hypothetical protein